MLFQRWWPVEGHVGRLIGWDGPRQQVYKRPCSARVKTEARATHKWMAGGQQAGAWETEVAGGRDRDC